MRRVHPEIRNESLYVTLTAAHPRHSSLIELPGQMLAGPGLPTGLRLRSPPRTWTSWGCQSLATHISAAPSGERVSEEFNDTRWAHQPVEEPGENAAPHQM